MGVCRQVKAIGIGDNVCDKYRHLGQMFPGGQALNFSVYCKLCGWDSAFIGVFGDDAAARHVQSTLDELGVDRSRCRTYPGENGYAVVDLKDGDRIFIMSNKGGMLRAHPLELSDADLAYIASFDIIHTSNNSYIGAQLPRLSALDNRLSYDFSGTWKEEAAAKEICQYLDFAFLSCSELSDEQVKGQLAKMYGWGCKIAVATMGARGAAAYDGSCFAVYRPQPVKAVDTLGAGDSLAAGFLMCYIQHTSDVGQQGDAKAFLETCIEQGAKLSAKTCMTQGAFGYGTAIV